MAMSKGPVILLTLFLHFSLHWEGCERKGGGVTPRPTSAPATQPARPPFVEDLLFVPVMVGGAEAGMWLIDTGATTSVVGASSPAAARIATLPMQANATAPSGVAKVRMGVASDVRFLNRVVEELAVIELDLRPAAAMMRRAFDGVLGVNALGSVYRLDFPNGRFLPGPFAEGTEGVLSFDWAGGAERPTVLGRINGKEARLTVDSGKNRVLNVNRAWLEENNIAFEESKAGLGLDAAGVGRQSRTKVASLEALGRTRAEVVAILGERPSGGSDGLIGVGLLRDAVIEINTGARTIRVLWVR